MLHVIRPRFAISRFLRSAASFRSTFPLQRRFNTTETEPPRASLASFELFTPLASETKIKGISESKFSVNDVVFKSPILIVNNVTFLWKVPQYGMGAKVYKDSEAKQGIFEGWSKEMVKMFELVEPLPEIVVFGTGATSARLPPSIAEYLKSLGMQVEVQATRSAVSTFNVLVQEQRRVAAALLPLLPTDAKGNVLVELKEKQRV